MKSQGRWGGDCLHVSSGLCVTATKFENYRPGAQISTSLIMSGAVLRL